MRLLALAFSACIVTASAAEESEWQTSWDGTLYGYANNMRLRTDSVLNPGNQIARLPQRSDTAELRLNLKAQNETVRLSARPIFSVRETSNVFGTEQHNEAYVSQWQIRGRVAENWNVSGGRDVMNWGAAQFRSPSSPFYFDNGRSDPIRELVGMDVVKISWNPDMQSSANLVRIIRSGYGSPSVDRWRDSWLAKFDQRGDEWSYGMVVVKPPHLPAFLGAHAQKTLNDAWMTYGEIGSSVDPYALQSSEDAMQPFSVQIPSSRHTTTLAGVAYTFESGNSLNAEYLHEDHGYTSSQESAYFQRANTLPNMALGLMPRLLGRDYLHLVWQSNVIGAVGYWRMMYTHNLTDNGNELSAYGESALSARVSIYALIAVPIGNARQEFSAIYTRNVTAGLKIALP